MNRINSFSLKKATLKISILQMNLLNETLYRILKRKNLRSGFLSFIIENKLMKKREEVTEISKKLFREEVEKAKQELNPKPMGRIVEIEEYLRFSA